MVGFSYTVGAPYPVDSSLHGEGAFPAWWVFPCMAAPCYEGISPFTAGSGGGIVFGVVERCPAVEPAVEPAAELGAVYGKINRSDAFLSV